MKKLLAILLALVVVGGAFAQVTTAISLSGQVTLYDQDGVTTFARDGADYDVVTFKAADADGKYGFSISDNNFIDGIGVPRDWNVWAKGKYTKVILGNLRNGDFRTLLTEGDVGVGSTNRITNYGVLVESLPMGGLTLGVNIPSPEAGADFADVIKNVDIGAKYDLEGFGSFTALVQLSNADAINATLGTKYDRDGVAATTTDVAFDALFLNFGVTYTGVENLTVNGVFKFVKSENLDASDIYFGLGGYYTMDKLYAYAEFAGINRDEFTWDTSVAGVYTIMDPMTAKLNVTYNSDNDYGVYGTLGYDYGNGLSSEIALGYGSADDFTYSTSLYYSVAF